MDTVTHYTVLASEFESFLQRLDQHGATVDGEPQTGSSPAIDLYSLFAAMTALQGEVRGEARLFKGALDDFKSVFASLDASQTTLRQELTHARQALAEQRQNLLKPVLLDWLDLRDSLVASLEHLAEIEPRGFYAKLRPRRARFIATLKQGQQMSLNKLDARLSHYGVERLETLGLPLEPATMRAVTTEQDPDQPEGIVIAELTSGFFWNGALLRYADVVINKHRLTEQS